MGFLFQTVEEMNCNMKCHYLTVNLLGSLRSEYIFCNIEWSYHIRIIISYDYGNGLILFLTVMSISVKQVKAPSRRYQLRLHYRWQNLWDQGPDAMYTVKSV